MKRMLAAAAMMAATVVLVVPGAAQAAPVKEQYVAVSSTGDLYGWFWVDRIDGIIGCAKCVWRIDLAKSHELLAADEKAFQSGLMSGLGKLSDAKVADPRTAAVLRQQALAQFQSAARALGTARAGVGIVGYYDPDTRRTTVVDRPWLAAADHDLATGVGYLQVALTDPEPSPWIVRATTEFDQAYGEIDAKTVL